MGDQNYNSDLEIYPIPIEGPRVTIRGFRAEDGDDLYSYLRLPEIYRFEPGNPLTREQAWETAGLRAKSQVFWAVELRQTGVMIGHLYFEKTKPHRYNTWVIGYIFNPEYHRLGYCTEACHVLLEYGFAQGIHKVTAMCNPENTASWRTLEKLGMTREGCFRQKAFFREDSVGQPIWHDAYAYGLIRGDYSPVLLE